MTDPSLAFPGATAVTGLDVYDWSGPDGEPGGSAHVHLLCTEAYIVVSGSGRLQTLGSAGFTETPLAPADVVWFTPGTIHRLINEDGLKILVVMQNAGLPEAGDAVLTFPPEILADRERYAAAASLADERHVYASDEAAARRRKDLAIEGFGELRRRVEEHGPGELDAFYDAAHKLVAPKLEAWESQLSAGAAAVADLAAKRLTALRGGDYSHLGAAAVVADAPSGPKLGMCGRLTTYGGSL